MRQGQLYRVALLFSCLSVFSDLSLSQVTTAQLTGRISDPTGAAVAGSVVTVTNLGTGIIRRTISNQEGHYAVPLLQPGLYRVDIQVEGFQPVSRTGIKLDVNQTARIDVTLRLGAIVEAIDVGVAAIELQTESASVQDLVGERTIESVPNITRNPYYYASVQPGVVPRAAFNDTQSVNAMGIGIDARRNVSAMSINGGLPFTSDIQLDGVSVLDAAWNSAAVVPIADGIREVRTIVNNFSAEYGRGQGVISITTRSGTKDWHGSVFYRARNEAFNANSFGNNSRNIGRPDFKSQTFGGTVGGPVKPGRAFFFFSYEELRHKRSVDYLRTVPTPLEKIGNFSQTLVSVSGVATPIKIYDPFNVTAKGNNVFGRMIFPNSVIPPSRVNPAIRNLFSFYPDPNRQPEDEFNRNNFFRRATQGFKRNNINSRVDRRLREKHSIYFTSGIQKGSIDTPLSWADHNPFYSRGPFIGNDVTDSNPYGAIGDTIVVSPSLVLDFRYGINRIVADNEARTFEDFNYEQFGIPSSFQPINAVPGAPIEFLPGGNLSPLNRANSLHKRERQTNHNFAWSATKVAGRWTLKFGGEYRIMLSNYTDAEESFWIQGSSNFTRELIDATGGGVGTVTADQAGWGPASYLLGAGWIHVAPGRGAKPALAQKYFALYSQNDWKATDRLTVNLGLRWDLQPGPTDRFDRLSAFDFAAVNPFGTRGAFAFCGHDDYSRSLWNTRKRDFGPRIGLAYRVTNSLVIRAGYGITYLPTNTGYFDGPFNYGMDSFSDFTSSDLYGPNPAGVLVGDFAQVTRVVRGAGADTTFAGLYGSDLLPRFDRNYQNGTVQQWNLFLEKRVGTAWLFSAGYLASKGDHLPYARVPLNGEQLLPRSLLESWRQDYIRRNGTGHAGNDPVPNQFQPDSDNLIPFNGSLGRAKITLRESLTPYPHFTTMQIQRSIGFSNYHAFQVQVKRQLTAGLQLNAHYTWSKSLDFTQTETFINGFKDTGGNTSTLDMGNFRNNYKLSLTDIPHRFVASYLYEFPFGRGKRFDPDNRIIAAIVSDWWIAGVATFQSGAPLVVSGGANGSLNGRPDRILGVPVEVPKNLQGWYDGKTTVTLPSGRQITPCYQCFLKYNVDAFRGRVVALPNGKYANDIFWYGTAAFTFDDIRDRGLNNWNMSIHRTFRPAEKFSLEFSAQFTNVWNHTQFRPSQDHGSLGATNVRPNPVRGLKVGAPTSDNFGALRDGTFEPRQMEFQIRLRF